MEQRLGKTQTRNSNKLICTRKRNTAKPDSINERGEGPREGGGVGGGGACGMWQGNGTNALVAEAGAVGIFVYEF